MGLLVCFITNEVAQQEDENPSLRSRILHARQPRSPIMRMRILSPKLSTGGEAESNKLAD
jgi:hypothetical protein